jgi:hypothetical protein
MSDIKRRNQFLEDEKKYGTAIAESKKFFNREEVQGASDTINQLVALQNSKNSQLKAIGKAAALAQITMDTARGAIAAYTSLAGIPMVGPALGAAAAAALVAYGAERFSIAARAQEGGVVPGIGSGDRVPMLLEPGEVIVPAPLAPTFIETVSRAQEGGSTGAMASLEITLKDSLMEFIEIKTNERRNLNISLLEA